VAVSRAGELSALQTLLGKPGAAARRSPGRRRNSVLLLIPPFLALAVVGVVQLSGAMNSTSPSAPINGDQVLPARGDPNGDLIPQTEISSIGLVDTTDIDRRIAFWQQRTATTASSETSWISLGDLLDLKGRMTGDINQFLAAQQAYQKAATVAPNSSAARAGSARELSTLHDFNGALDAATQTVALDPNAVGALGVVFDASVELGHISDAQLALQDLQARVQGPSIAVRQARLDFLAGDTKSAVDLVEGAASDAADEGDLPSSIAFYDYTAAEYELFAGNLDAAQTDSAKALAMLPGYPLAIYDEGRVAYARGDLTGAIGYLEAATAALPRPDMLAFLGDLYSLNGNSAKATNEYATVDFIAQVTEQSGAGKVYDREYGLYLSEHGTNVTRALDIAQSEIQYRQDEYGYDALAMALHANGQDAEALQDVGKALALGTADPRILLHAGLIELANGETATGQAHLAQALALNPTVSPLLVEQARKALGQ